MSNQILMTGTGMVPEMSVVLDQMTRLLTQHDYFNFSRLEDISSYLASCTSLDKINKRVTREELGNFN
jgi:hypothetical protein